MDVRKMLARLNPAVCRFDIGRGGVPEWTPQDVAAALGMVPAGLGRELLCAAWWPDGARLSHRELVAALERVQREEWWRREQDMLHATLAVASHHGGDDLRRAQSLYASAHAGRWPSWVEDIELGSHNTKYLRMRSAVVVELTSPKLCPDCHGRGEIAMKSGVVKDCDKCCGRGSVAHTHAWRAEQMKIREDTYRKTWAGPYEWLFDYSADAMQKAQRDMERVMQ